MKSIAAAAAVLTLLAAIAAGQPAAQAARVDKPPSNDLVLRFDVDLVQVDVVVTDRKGNHIATLQPEDFEVLQDGKRQKITHFSYVQPLPRTQDVPASTTNQQLERSQARRMVVIVIDDTDIEFGDFVFVQRALRRYIQQGLQPGDAVALLRTSGGSAAMQQFSNSSKYLDIALHRLVWRPRMLGSSYALTSSLARAISALSGYPGRKSIVLISPGRPNVPMAESYMFEGIRRISDLANRSSVTIHTIDSRGLPVLWAHGQADATQPGSVSRRPPDLDVSLLPDFEYFDSETTLSMFATSTGGLFLHNSNDLFGAVRTAVDDSEGYYLIGWYPGANAFKQKPGRVIDYHGLKIKVKQKHLQARTRAGYYAYTGVSRGPMEHFSAETQIEDALFSPFRSGDIAVDLTASFQYDDKGESYIQSLLHIGPQGIEFHPEWSSQNCATVNLEFLAVPVLLDWNKETREKQEWQRTELEVCGSAREQALRDGLVAVVRSPIQHPGPYQIRVAVRNLPPGWQHSSATPLLLELTQRDSTTPVLIPIGSAVETLEIPDLRKARLELTGVWLGSSTARAEKPADEISIRLATDSDSAVRRFHPGASLKYAFREFQQSPEIETRLQVLGNGKPIYTSDPLEVKLGDWFNGVYELPSSATPGKYLLGIVANESGKGKRRSAAQWIDFEVLK